MYIKGCLHWKRSTQIESPKPLKLLYLDSLKQFGMKDGLQIYHKVKQVI